MNQISLFVIDQVTAGIAVGYCQAIVMILIHLIKQLQIPDKSEFDNNADFYGNEQSQLISDPLSIFLTGTFWWNSSTQ